MVSPSVILKIFGYGGVRYLDTKYFYALLKDLLHFAFLQRVRALVLVHRLDITMLMPGTFAP